MGEHIHVFFYYNLFKVYWHMDKNNVKGKQSGKFWLNSNIYFFLF